MSVETRPCISYGVFLHSSGEQGGWVVRTMYDGWAPAPYSRVEPIKTYKREHAAQQHADRLNGRRV